MQLFSTFIIIRKVSNQHVRIISKGSCDTKDWSSDAENSAVTWNSILNSIVKLQNITVFAAYLIKQMEYWCAYMLKQNNKIVSAPNFSTVYVNKVEFGCQMKFNVQVRDPAETSEACTCSCSGRLTDLWHYSLTVDFNISMTSRITNFTVHSGLYQI